MQASPTTQHAVLRRARADVDSAQQAALPAFAAGMHRPGVAEVVATWTDALEVSSMVTCRRSARALVLSASFIRWSVRPLVY